MCRVNSYKANYRPSNNNNNNNNNNNSVLVTAMQKEKYSHFEAQSLPKNIKIDFLQHVKHTASPQKNLFNAL
jgi:hypothetical protein